jgi:hypothetical protein
VPIHDLEVALRDRHVRVEFQSAHEALHGLRRQPAAEVEHAEIVVGTGIRRIDATRE